MREDSATDQNKVASQFQLSHASSKRTRRRYYYLNRLWKTLRADKNRADQCWVKDEYTIHCLLKNLARKEVGKVAKWSWWIIRWVSTQQMKWSAQWAVYWFAPGRAGPSAYTSAGVRSGDLGVTNEQAHMPSQCISRKRAPTRGWMQKTSRLSLAVSAMDKAEAYSTPIRNDTLTICEEAMTLRTHTQNSCKYSFTILCGHSSVLTWTV